MKRDGGSDAAASLTIEASLSLTLFLFTVILLSVPMEILDTQRKVQTALEAAGRELSQSAYLLGSGAEKGDGTKGDKAEEASDLVKSLGEGAVSLYLSGKIRSAVGDKRIRNLDCSKTSVSENGEIIDLRAAYRLKLPFSIFKLDSILLSSRSLRRGWIGSEGGRLKRSDREKEKELMVYIGKGSTRYHISPNCHYISNEITRVSMDEMDQYTNNAGRRYRFCRVCNKNSGNMDSGFVYILPGGEYYHSRADCSSLNYYVRQVPLSEAEHLGACSYCGSGKGRRE